MSVYHMEDRKSPPERICRRPRYRTLCGKHPLMIGYWSFTTTDKSRVTCKLCLKKLKGGAT
ncbi:MAG: hypothetical protein NT069_25940 [Planctomycetota bacterium]|nr:hypothetical protein [Planctomycetota bacterium]